MGWETRETRREQSRVRKYGGTDGTWIRGIGSTKKAGLEEGRGGRGTKVERDFWREAASGGSGAYPSMDMADAVGCGVVDGQLGGGLGGHWIGSLVGRWEPERHSKGTR